jgi:hypothetical protein
VLRRSTRHGAADSLRTAPPEGGTAWRNPTGRSNRPLLRGPLAADPVELHEGVATSTPSTPHIEANSLHTWNRGDAGDPKATFASAIPSEELTPSGHLAAASRHLSRLVQCSTNTRPSSLLADDPYQRCRWQRPFRSATENDRKRTTTRRSVDLRPPPETGCELRAADAPGTPTAAADRSPLVLATSCTVNPMNGRNARLVPIDY